MIAPPFTCPLGCWVKTISAVCLPKAYQPKVLFSFHSLVSTHFPISNKLVSGARCVVAIVKHSLAMMCKLLKAASLSSFVIGGSDGHCTYVHFVSEALAMYVRTDHR